MQEQSFAAGECPNCGHDFTAHSAWIGYPGDTTCVTAVIAGECDIADEHRQLVIRYDERDPIIHTDEYPWCDDPDCPCHYDFTASGEAEYQALIEQPLADGLFTEAEAARLYDGKQVKR